MRKANFTNVDEYTSAQPESAQVVLQVVRSPLRKALPGAEEVISYKIPAYKLHGGICCTSLAGSSATRCTPRAAMRLNDRPTEATNGGF
jgi:uncharacterized protein YdhG (YjbR/CyaY superfamily)